MSFASRRLSFFLIFWLSNGPPSEERNYRSSCVLGCLARSKSVIYARFILHPTIHSISSSSSPLVKVYQRPFIRTSGNLQYTRIRLFPVAITDITPRHRILVWFLFRQKYRFPCTFRSVRRARVNIVVFTWHIPVFRAVPREGVP